MSIYSIIPLFFLASCIVPKQEADPGFAIRSELLIDVVAGYYTPPSMDIGDPEKYYWPKAIARFDKYGINDTLANGWIDELKDRSPFHFTLVGMARLMALYPDAPGIKNNRSVLLEKVFERDDSHNPWTSEGTENHINMDRTSGYLFTQYALDYPELFPEASSRLGLMKEWISRWSKTIYRYGTGEWNSGIYQAYHMIGWLNLYDFAEDREVKDIARAVLDYYSAEMALHYSWGTYGGSEKRGQGARDVNTTASNYLCWLWFGLQNDSVPEASRGGEYIQSVHAATSAYFPPEAIRQLAAKNFDKPAFYANSKPSYLFDHPSFVKQFFYIDENFTLGTAVSPYGGWTGSTYQFVNWKLAVRNNSGNPYEISGNGRFHDTWSGIAANPWTQFAQHKNVLVQMTMTPANKNELITAVEEKTGQWQKDWQRDFSRRFPDDNKPNVVNFARNIVAENLSFINLPSNTAIVFENNRCFAELGDVYLAINFIGTDHADADKNLIISGSRLLVTDKAPPGDLCGFVMEVVEAGNFESFRHFKQTYNQQDRLECLADRNRISYFSSCGRNIKAGYNASGFFTEALYDWGYGVTEPQTFTFDAPWQQPQWPAGEGYGKIPYLSVDGDSINFNEEWPVFSGPHLMLKDGILEIAVRDHFYEVDYSGNRPLFSR